MIQLRTLSNLSDILPNHLVASTSLRESSFDNILIVRPPSFGKSHLADTLFADCHNNTSIRGGNFEVNAIRLVFDTTGMGAAHEENMQDYMKYTVSSAYRDHYYLLNSPNISKVDSELYRQYRLQERDDLELAIFHLSRLLYNYNKKKSVVIIDEYDMPAVAAWLHHRDHFVGVFTFFRKFYHDVLANAQYFQKTVLFGATESNYFEDGKIFKVNSVFKKEIEVPCFDLKVSEISGNIGDVIHRSGGYNLHGDEIINIGALLAISKSHIDYKDYRYQYPDEILSLLVFGTVSVLRNLYELILRKEQVSIKIPRIFCVENKADEQIWYLLLHLGYVWKVSDTENISVGICEGKTEEFKTVVIHWLSYITGDRLMELSDAIYNRNAVGIREIFETATMIALARNGSSELFFHAVAVGLACFSTKSYQEIQVKRVETNWYTIQIHRDGDFIAYLNMKYLSAEGDETNVKSHEVMSKLHSVQANNENSLGLVMQRANIWIFEPTAREKRS